VTDGRTDVPTSGVGEREMLRAYLDSHRDTLATKCAGLSDDELRRQAVPPSGLSLLGLVRHMAEVERSWFRRVLDGQDAPFLWGDGHAAAWDVDGAAPEEAFAAWQAGIAIARDIEAAAPSLDVTGVHRDGSEYSLRRVLLHLVQEYARHNGHADLVRERIDGATGV
jgi:prepilin-type processing-associated H-X9-DG protein